MAGRKEEETVDSREQEPYVVEEAERVSVLQEEEKEPATFLLPLSAAVLLAALFLMSSSC